MEIKLNENKTDLKWQFKENLITVSRKKIIFFKRQKHSIFLVYLGEDGEQKEEFIDFEGNFFYSFDFKNHTIYFRNKKIIVDNLIDAGYNLNSDVFLVLVGESRLDCMLKVIRTDGGIIKNINPPKNFSFYGFQTSDTGDVLVVCMGNESEADKYGRNTWQFKLDIETGYLNKFDLSP